MKIAKGFVSFISLCDNPSRKGDYFQGRHQPKIEGRTASREGGQRAEGSNRVEDVLKFCTRN